MLNTCITSTISVRTRGSSLPCSTNDYSHCSNLTHPFFYSSSRPCCCCCCSYPMYKVPVTPDYCYNLYGLRQSSLIQWSYRRLNFRGGFDRCYYGRSPVSDVCGICFSDRACNFSEESVGTRKGGFRRCVVFDERSERYGIGCIDEAEIVLSLLTEDVDGECFRVKMGSGRSVKKPVVEKSRNKFLGKKRRVGVGVVGSEPSCNSKSIGKIRKNDNRRREEVIWREEERETLLREENKKEREDVANRMVSEKEGEALLRKPRRKVDEEQERESMLRRENWKVRSRTEEREDSLRREEQRQKVRKEGSSCSSYYSFSSTGDRESESESELSQGMFLGDSSSGHMKNSSIEMVDENAREEYKRHGIFTEDHGKSLTKMNTGKEFFVGSSAVESVFRKKSVKKLTDVSVEEMRPSKRSSLKDSNFPTPHKSNYEKVSDHYCDDLKVKSGGSTKCDEERKRQLLLTGDEDLKQSETRTKYKQFVEMQDTRSDNVRNSYGSQKLYSGKGEMSAKVASQEKIGEIRAAVGLGSGEDKYENNSHKVSEVSENQEIDIGKTSVSQQRFEPSVKEEDYSANVLTSINVAGKQQQDDRVSGQLESRGTPQDWTNKNGKSILKQESGKLIKDEDRLNLAYGSSLEPKQACSQAHAEIIKRVNSRNEYEESITHSGNSCAIFVDNRNKTESETPARSGTNVFDDGRRGHNEGISPLSRHNSSHGQPSMFSHEDAIGSAARLEKSSAHYVGEFVNQLRSEISSFEIRREEKTYEPKSVPEEQHFEKNLLQYSSGDPHSEEHDLTQDDQPSGSKGPSDEMWKVDEPSAQKLPKSEIQDNASKSENAVIKRDAKSLWNIFADIFRLRWSPRSESHSSGRKTGGRNSPNLSTSSETWFSGHEAEENEGTSITQGLSSRRQEVKTHPLVEEGSTSSTSVGYPKNVGMNEPFSSVVLETSGKNGNSSSAAIVESSITIPALRLRRFSAMRGALETGKENPPEIVLSIEQPESAVKEEELKQNKLQRKDQVVKDRFDEWEEAYILEKEQRKIDEMFMREALLEAKKAADSWEVPVGAVLVHNGKIIARGCNLVEEMRDSTAHAEMICIREGSNVLRTWRLSETTLYVTLEPCPMCAGALLQARVHTVVWGAPNKLLGADGSWIRLFPSGGGGNNDLVQTDKPAAPVHPFHPKMVVRRGVLASECADEMQQFFKLRRRTDKKHETPSTPPPSCLPISHRPSKFLAKMHGFFSLMFCL